MLNTGLRTGEVLGLLNSDIDLANRVMHLNRGVKEISKRDGVTAEKGREVKVGKLKSATSKRDVPLNDTAIEMILDLRKEFYLGDNSPLIPDENGNFTVDPMIMGIGEVELPESCRNLPEITVTLNYCVQPVLYVLEGDSMSCATAPIQRYPVNITIQNNTQP